VEDKADEEAFEDTSNDSSEMVAFFRVTGKRVILLLSVLAVADYFLLHSMRFLPALPRPFDYLIEALALAFVSLPILHVTILRDFYRTQTEVDSLYDRLRAQKRTLRTKVKIQTRELEELNQHLEKTISELETTAQEQLLLAEMTDMLQSCNSAEEAYTIFGDFGEQLCPQASGALCIIAQSRNFLELVSEWGDTQFMERVFAPDECWSLRRGQGYHSSHERPARTCPHVEACEGQRYVCMPLNAQGEAIGVFTLALPLTGETAEGTETARHLERVARQMADAVSVAVANLWLREKLHEQSIRDGLTKLYNRRYMEEFLDRELQRAVRQDGPVTVVMLDVDKF